MTINICHDHLGGFDSTYYSPQLSECDPGQVQIEYILPHNVKSLYPKLDIQFSAFVMVRNNHFEKFLNLPPPNIVDPKERTNFLCSFNKSKHISRLQFVMSLFVEGLYDPEFCSKYFAITDLEWLEFVRKLPIEHQSNVSFGKIQEFISATQQHGGMPVETIGQIRRDLTDLAPLMEKSFITAVAETAADSYVPFPTEKICLPMATKSLWIAYAQPGYHKFVEKYLGIKTFAGIDYSFDEILDPTQRLKVLMKELKRLQQLDAQQKIELYNINHQELDYNFSILSSGEMIANIWQHDECFEHYKEFAMLSKMSNDINTNLSNQWAVVLKWFVEREKHYRQFGRQS